MGCAFTHAPRNWLQNPTQLQMDGRGGWIYVVTETGRRYKGELIAVDHDSLYVAYDTLMVIAQGEVKRARLVAYKANQEVMGQIIFWGSSLSICHGYLSVLTGITYVLSGLILMYHRSYDPIVDYPLRTWEAFTPFARFPQGLPQEIALHELTGRRRM